MRIQIVRGQIFYKNEITACLVFFINVIFYAKQETIKGEAMKTQALVYAAMW